MPKFDKKRSRKDSDTSDSGPEDRSPAKKATPAAKKPAGNPSKDGEEPSWSLGNMKFIKVREFKGKTYIDIREYYVDKQTMETRPGKKGISLNCEQYQKLKEVLSEVDGALP